VILRNVASGNGPGQVTLVHFTAGDFGWLFGNENLRFGKRKNFADLNRWDVCGFHA
jgi:hypothetical protein